MDHAAACVVGTIGCRFGERDVEFIRRPPLRLETQEDPKVDIFFDDRLAGGRTESVGAASFNQA
jgi:hypothetical protein